MIKNKLASIWGEHVKDSGNIFTESSHPFYVISPPYVRNSAGVKALHALCHYLNLLGENAYMHIFPADFNDSNLFPYYLHELSKPHLNPDLLTPLLTDEIADYHFTQGKTPICILPEVYDNTLDAPFIVRYILNFPGLLAPKYKQPQDMTIAYSKRLAEYVGAGDSIHIPTLDLNYFFVNENIKKTETCYYAGKCKDIYNSSIELPIPEGCIEILRSSQMPQSEVRDIFWRSNYFYCFEDTALATEAVLCGCTTVFMPNENFVNAPIALYELGSNGFSWGNDPASIKEADETKYGLREKIEAYYSAVPKKIADFSERAKKSVKDVPYSKKINLGHHIKMHYIDFSIDEWENRNFSFYHEEEAIQELVPDIQQVVQVAPEAVQVTPVITVPFKRKVKIVLKEWVFPPKFSRFFGRIYKKVKFWG